MSGSSPGAFESFVGNLLTGTFLSSAPILLAPFGRVWSALWQLDPFDYWISILLAYDFFQTPQALGFDEEEFVPPLNDERDFDAIVRVLERSARDSVLSPNWQDQPDGGRVPLPLDKIDAVDDARWGPLKALADLYEIGVAIRRPSTSPATSA